MLKMKMLALASTAALVAMPASAAVTMYQNSGDFLAAAPGAVLNDLNAIPVGTNVANGVYPGVTVSSSGTSATFASGANAYNVNGSTFLLVNISGGSITATFSSTVYAFGANFSSLNNDILRTTITVGGTTFDPLPMSPSFLGFVSDTGFNSITFTNPLTGGDNDLFGVDNILFSTSGAVPEPASWAMMILGMGVVGFAMRSRKTAVRFA